MPQTELLHQQPERTGFLVVRGGKRHGKSFKLGPVNRMGRDATNYVSLDFDSTVSAHHAVIKFEHGQFVLYDLASSNQTFLNGHPIQKQALMDDDVIQLGNVTLVFKEVK